MLWILDWFWERWNNVTDFFEVWYHRAKDVSNNIWTWLWDNANMAYQWAIDWSSYYIQVLRNEVAVWIQELSDFAEFIVEGTKELLFYYINALIDWVSLLQQQVDSLGNTVRQAAIDFIVGLWGWIIDALIAIWDSLVLVKDFVINQIMNAWNFILGLITFFADGSFYDMLVTLKDYLPDLLLILQSPFSWLFTYLVDIILDILEEALADAFEG